MPVSQVPSSSLPPAPKKAALVLAGAFAKGGFEAGVLSALLPQLKARGYEVSRIVATSAGALSGAVLAAGIRAGRSEEALQTLEHFWEYEATVNMFRPSPSDLLSLRGVFSMDRAAAMLRQHYQRYGAMPGPRSPIAISLVVARLEGRLLEVGQNSYSSFEQVVTFSNTHFERDSEKIIAAACASGCVPFLFAPIELTDENGNQLGRCYDGGAVNNTPIKEALDGDVDTVIIINPFPQRQKASAIRDPLSLLDQLLTILINERLFRDIREAHWANSTLRNIEALVQARCSDPASAQELHQSILKSIGMPKGRQISLLEVRPEEPLQGTVLTAIFSRAMRRDHIAAGKHAALTMMRDVS